jgi:hypothetical protein
MTRTGSVLRSFVFGLALLVASSSQLFGQSVASTSLIRDPHDGDCSVVFEMPVTAAGAELRFLLNKHPLTVTILQPSPVVAGLAEPLHQGDEVRVIVSGMEYAKVVGAARPGRKAECAGPPPPGDGRSALEASGYLGSVFDNFAPNVVGAYENADAASGTKSRWMAGVEAQYRLLGKPSDTVQLWLSTKTLHGVRTADVNCQETPSVAVCNSSATTSDKFLYILQHASTMEAHVDPRLELLTLQAGSDVPAKFYVGARFGFLDLEGAPKVFNSDSVGVGLLAPSGVFKGSMAQVGWGRSEQFQSNSSWNRLKFDGMLAFDVLPSLTDQLQFWKQLGGALRVFIAISVDRNPGGPGPDSVQSYVGIDFDLRRAFNAFAP